MGWISTEGRGRPLPFQDSHNWGRCHRWSAPIRSRRSNVRSAPFDACTGQRSDPKTASCVAVGAHFGHKPRWRRLRRLAWSRFLGDTAQVGVKTVRHRPTKSVTEHYLRSARGRDLRRRACRRAFSVAGASLRRRQRPVSSSPVVTGMVGGSGVQSRLWHRDGLRSS